MTTFVDVSLVCPACNGSFLSRLITSCGNRGHDTDFRPHYWGLDPVPYFVHTCGHCEFSGFMDDFIEAEGEQSDSQSRHEGPAGGDPLPGSRKYELAAERYAAARPADHQLVGDLYLRGSWCARLEEAPAKEAALQRQAVLHFEAALEEADLGREQQAATTYLVGELYRRIGRFDFAQALFVKCAELEWPDGELDWLGPLVDRQASLARQAIADNTTFEP